MFRYVRNTLVLQPYLFYLYKIYTIVIQMYCLKK
nr:MAG TPA: hypothetical protein [Caudoviricetes sp.]